MVPCKMRNPVSRIPRPVKNGKSRPRTNASRAKLESQFPHKQNPAVMLKSRIPRIEARGIPTFAKVVLPRRRTDSSTQAASHRFNSLRSQVFFSPRFSRKHLYPMLVVSPPRPPVQHREIPKKTFYFTVKEQRETRARSERHTHTHGRDQHSMNLNEAVASEVATPAASEVAAPAASEAATPAAGQESTGVGPSGPDGLPVATPAGSAAAGVQLGTLPSSKTLFSSKIPSSPVGAASR